jgi:hypothetical protein
MRSVAIVILTCSNIFDDNRLKLMPNAQNSLLNIKLCLKNDRFKSFCIAIFHNDIDCLKCHLFHISLLRLLRRSKKMMMIFVFRKNRLLLFVAKKYERCHEFSLKMINSINKLLSSLSWFCTIRFTYDLIFWMIVLFLCAWWIITLRFQRRIQMRHFFFVCIEFLIILCIN